MPSGQQSCVGLGDRKLHPEQAEPSKDATVRERRHFQVQDLPQEEASELDAAAEN